jgi:membrane protein implicated in regulation of membrane protease activity
MDTLFPGGLTTQILANPFWLWLTLGAILLAVEAAASTEWLLWPAAAAGVVAVITLTGLDLSLPVQGMIFAGLTIAGAVMSRTLLASKPTTGPDRNDPEARLIGQAGEVSTAFEGRMGRVFVDGTEWSAELEEGETLAEKERVIVTGINGTRLRIRAVVPTVLHVAKAADPVTSQGQS